ncbi:E4 SUMO-protein ligase PIAL2-like isoform X2 [Tripterygium wilfordii]|uniref:E4 SUMO-protein ligase PIAL2-like isoform X2 n=1 Tax=Tripterygium wilfordii TaxID=458696 RepID=UPI0018F7EA4E|nr:E4 SUMO-protein ligase PIAL2-like isoform X2 [Tripterygium wilfordii]
MAAISPELVAVMARWQQKTVSLMNSSRVAAVAERLVWLLHSARKNSTKEIQNLCLSLARGIDYALANNEIPDKAQELPRLLKQICQLKNDLSVVAGVMVLMISVKNACKIGWFSEMESQELLTLVNEIGSSFCSIKDVQTGPSDFHSIISMIMGRFYPLMKIGQVLASLEVKPGYEAYAVDFNIPKTISHSPEEKIDTGPQIPTNVTGMLQYGANLLQAVGQFNGNFIVVLAFMSISSLPEAPVLEDYVQSETPMTDSENDIIEGPSRISLKCPISFRRVAIPVKGYRCKHLQCFDFSNYVIINSRRPSWRCPHCNQPVCYTELRIDQNMVKVLREVGEEVTDIIISADGSWKAVLERDDNEDVAHDTELHLNEKAELQESTPGPIFLDLTEDDDKVDTLGSYENEDRKVVPADLRNPSVCTNFTTQPDVNDMNISSQNATAQIEDEFWSGVYLSNLSVPSYVSSGAEIRISTSESTSADFLMSPVLTDAISPAFNQRAERHVNINPTTSALQSQFSAPTNLQLQQAQFVNSTTLQSEYGRSAAIPSNQNEYGRSASVPRNITRTPVAVQALPALSQTNAPQQRARSGYSAQSLASQASLPVAPSANNYRLISDGAPSLLHQHTAAQNVSLQDCTFIPGQSVQQNAGIQASNPFPCAYRRSTEFQNPHLQQALNPRSQSPFLRPVTSYPINQDGARASTAEQWGSIGGTLRPVSRADGLVDLPSEQNWRPVGRMRGSLSGQAYSAALSQYLNLPTQSAQVGMLPNLSLPSSSVPAHFQAFFANRSVPPSLQNQNSSRTGAAGTSGVSGYPPAHSMWMN